MVATVSSKDATPHKMGKGYRVGANARDTMNTMSHASDDTMRR
jgi:hypothetical protein